MSGNLGKIDAAISLAKSLAERVSPGVDDVSVPKAGQAIPVQHIPVPGFAGGGKTARRALMVASGLRRADGGGVDDDSNDLNDMGLYSQAAKAAAALPQAKGTGQQMLASLKGVKPEEM